VKVYRACSFKTLYFRDVGTDTDMLQVTFRSSSMLLTLSPEVVLGQTIRKDNAQIRHPSSIS
jgi:hypothetical protein